MYYTQPQQQTSWLDIAGHPVTIGTAILISFGFALMYIFKHDSDVDELYEEHEPEEAILYEDELEEIEMDVAEHYETPVNTWESNRERMSKLGKLSAIARQKKTVT